jgi:hypothetical protein
MKNLLILMSLLTLFTLGCKSSKEKVQEGTPQKQATSGSATKSEEAGKAEKTVVARVNGTPIYKEELRGMPLQSAINDEILYQEGLNQGLDKKLADKVNEYKRTIIIGNVKKEIMLKAAKNEPKTVNDEEIQEYYNSHKDRYGEPNLRLKAIFSEDKDIADEIHKKALNGEEFEKIASEYSDSGKKVTVQQRGFTNVYDERFNVLEVGQISNVFKTARGYVTLKIIEISNQPSRGQKQKIRFDILNQRRADALEKGIEQIKKANNVKVQIVGEGGS